MSKPSFGSFTMPQMPHSILDNSLFHYTPIVVDCLRDRRGGRAHWHDYPQIWYVLKGNMRHQIGETIYQQTPGTAAIVLPYMLHAVDTRVSVEMPEILSIVFDDDFFIDEGVSLFTYDNLHASFEGWACPTVCSLADKDRRTADELAERLLSEFSSRAPLSVPKIRALAYQLLVLLCVDANESGRKRRRIDPARRERGNLITQSARYIFDNTGRKLSIDELCSVALMSRRTFTENFREVTGTTFAQYLLSSRLKKARRQLASTNLPVAQIAESLGFAHSSHLCRAFTKNFGLSPTAYRSLAMRRELDWQNAFVDKWGWLNPSLAKVDPDVLIP